MRLTSLVIGNHRFVVIVFLLLIVAGIDSFFQMPRTENPEITVPAASVFAVYPGVSISDLEQLVAQPIEDALNELEDIKRVSTIIRDGLVVTHVEFFFGVDADERYEKIVQEVNAVKSKLPADLYALETMKWRVSDVVLKQMAFVGDSISYDLLLLEAEKLKDNLRKIPEIRKVDILAYPEQEVRIALDMEKMAVLSISIDEVGQIIAANNANIPGGNILVGEKSYAVKTSGAYQNLEDIANTVIATSGGKVVRLRDIASVYFDYADNRYIARFGGQKAVFVTIYQKEGFNVIHSVAKIDEVLERFRRNFSGDIRLETVFNQANEVIAAINGFQTNLFQGIALVGILIFLSLGFKSAILVIVAIPLSLLMGLFGVDASGYAMQQMTIAGLVIALGLLVDNSIVMIEAINRFLQMGHKARQAAVMAAQEIGWPIVTSTLTTVLAFVPIITMPDKAGVFIRSMPVAIIFTLSFSLLIALTLTPLLAAWLFKKHDSNIDSNPTRKRKGWIQRVFRIFIEVYYRKTIVYALQHRWMVIGVSLAIFVVTMGVAIMNLGVSFFPKAEKGQFMVRTVLPEGSSLDATKRVVKFVEEVLQSVPDVNYYASNVGHGNPRVYYNVLTESYLRNFGEVFVQLKSFDAKRFAVLVDSLRDVFNGYFAAEINIKEFEQSPPVDAPVMIYILGTDIDYLRTISARFETLLRKQPGVLNVDNSLSGVRTDLHIDVNRDKANMLGIPLFQIDKAVRAAVAGIQIDDFRDEHGKEYAMVLRMPEGDSVSLADFRKVYVKSLSGNMIPLMQVADVQFAQGPSEMRRFNHERTALITADLRKGASLDAALQNVLVELESYDFPEGYSYYIGGELESRNESFGGMQRAVWLALLLIFAVLVLQFKSYKQPFIIFAAIPLAMVGCVYALLGTGLTFSFTAFIGFTSLVGIVINNSIMLVDYTNRLRHDGHEKNEALRIAGETRFTPIILTTLTTVGGLLPLTLQGGDLWAPMGWTIIGGLLVSTFLTLIVVPVLYGVLERD